ncbi:MAG: outer membrane protein assembly factor BamA [Aestuariivirga sp.]|uniref:outer membrane protein assembly factor BamA n=1 Tax=Aestuariivirga sp. TaxID=2650926 RepID=UPI0025BC8D6C|nr:outer membrane protein assembly factor BamA [Aestuariivirga sp.]MCA3562568.1 outer membrane protein assembly factor BamA [Aestuariivirga sp.]
MRYKFVFVAFLAFVLSVLAPVAAPGVAATAVYADVVTAIVVEGNKRIESDTILSYVQVSRGQNATPEKVDESVKALFQTGLFSDVQITRSGNTLVVKVDENPMVNEVNFEGNKAVKDTDLAKEVELRERMMFTRAKVLSDVNRIIAVYRRAGYYNVKVSPKIIRLPENRVNLVYEINEGGETKVRQIDFVGNNAFSAGQLKSVIGTQQYAWWRFYNRNDTYDSDRLEYDKELLRRYYLRNGFADVQVISAEAVLTPSGDGFIITFTIDEGPRYKVADVAVNVGDAQLDSKDLIAKVKTGVGDYFDATKVDKTVEQLTLEAARQGFVFARVNPDIARDAGDKSLNITYNIVEGPRTYIERIDIVGNYRTEDEVIRRELNLFEGDAFNRVVIERARRRLTALDYFEKIDFQESEGSAPDRVVLTVVVQEKSTGSVNFSLGYARQEKIVGSVSLQERNFLGKGYDVKVNVSGSWYRQNVTLSFTDPYFMGLPVSAGFDVFATNVDNQQESNYNSQMLGFALRTGFRIDEYSGISFRYGFTWRDVNGINKAQASPAVIESVGESTKSAVMASYTWDNLDNPVRPTNGFRGQLEGELAGLGGDVHYGKLEAHGWYFLPVYEDAVVLKIEGNAGQILPFNGDNVRLQDRFFKGGDTFRGFQPAGVGPRQRGNSGSTDAVGGKTYAIGTLEMTFPIGLPEQWGVLGEAFTDFGTVFDSGVDTVLAGQGDCSYGNNKLPLGSKASNCTSYDSAAFRLSVGTGVIWSSPFGPLRFEAAYPLLKAERDKTEYFRFSVGTAF